MAYLCVNAPPIGLEVRCLFHNLLQVIKKNCIVPCFWGSVSPKKKHHLRGFFSFFGCGLVCGGGVSLGAVVGWVGLGVVSWSGCGVVFTSWCGAVGAWCCVGAVFLPWRYPSWVHGLVLAWVLVGLWWACGGGPVWTSLKNGPRVNRAGRVGIEAVSIFGHPPPYVCILCRGWRGCVVGWACVIRAILSGFR